MTIIWSEFVSSPDVHFIDPIKMLKVGSKHEDGKEVDAQFWIVHVSEKIQNQDVYWKYVKYYCKTNSLFGM